VVHSQIAIRPRVRAAATECGRRSEWDSGVRLVVDHGESNRGSYRVNCCMNGPVDRVPERKNGQSACMAGNVASGKRGRQ
jgi:hypothetical protein